MKTNKKKLKCSKSKENRQRSLLSQEKQLRKEGKDQ